MQILEQTFKKYFNHKQAFQMEISEETMSTLKEIGKKKTKEDVYKLMGQLCNKKKKIKEDIKKNQKIRKALKIKIRNSLEK